MNLTKQDVKNIFKIVTFAVVLYWILQNLMKVNEIFGGVIDVLLPFIIGAVLAFFLNLLMKFYEERLFKPRKSKRGKIIEVKGKRVISIFLALLTFIAILILIFGLIIPELINAIKLFIEKFPQIATDLKDYAISLTDNYPEIRDYISNINWDFETIKSGIYNMGGNIVTSSIGIINNFISGVWNVIIAIIFSAYILISKDTLARQLKKIVYAFAPKDKVRKTLDIMVMSKNTINNFVAGQCTEAVILGTLCAVGMLSFGLPYGITISVLVAFTALIPIVGAFLGAIIGAILILSVSLSKAIIFIIFIIVLQQIEGNIIYPKVVGNSIGLPGMWVLLAVAVGGSLFGIIGMLIGVPCAAILYSIIKIEVNSRLKDKKID